MSPRKSPERAKRSYHHGDLRRALLDAARALVEAHGMQALTLREVARKVGVTHAAPYHHFRTRELLLDALAEEGFDLLDAAMREALAGHDQPDQRLRIIGRAYIDFGRANPDRLQVMFRRRSEPSHEPRAALGEDSPHPKVFAHLFDAVQACQQAGVAPAGDPYALALTAWSIVHGFAKLWTEGPLDALEPYAMHFDALRDDMLQRFGDSWRALAHAERKKKRS